MSLEFRVLWAGRRLPPQWERLCADYRQRIAAIHPIVERPIRVAASGNDPSRLEREAAALVAAAPEEGLWWAFERCGTQLDSDAWAAEVGRWRREWSRPVVFFIGSDLGLAPSLQARCRRTISLGPLTLPHALARLVVLEQLFRALAREIGLPYHRP